MYLLSSILQLFAAKSGVEELFAEDDLVSSSAASSRRESYCSTEGVGGGTGEGGGKGRRRSSTSDALRFRQRMQQTSSHEGETPSNLGEGRMRQNSSSSSTIGGAASVERPSTESGQRTEPEIKIIAASVSSHESSDSSAPRTTITATISGASKSSEKRAISAESIIRDKGEGEDSAQLSSSQCSTGKGVTNQTTSTITTTTHNGSRSSSEERKAGRGREGGNTGRVVSHSSMENEL